MTVDNYQKKGKQNLVDDVIFGEIPDGFIICGWMIKTNVNSKPYDVVYTWNRRKGLSIIGGSCFKFKVNIFETDSKLNKDIEVEWVLYIFCIQNF